MDDKLHAAEERIINSVMNVRIMKVNGQLVDVDAYKSSPSQVYRCPRLYTRKNSNLKTTADVRRLLLNYLITLNELIRVLLCVTSPLLKLKSVIFRLTTMNVITMHYFKRTLVAIFFFLKYLLITRP